MAASWNRLGIGCLSLLVSVVAKAWRNSVLFHSPHT
jgi:hypothetical protein